MQKQTKILYADQKQDVATAASLIQQGKIVAVPTETVYGLAADARNINAVKQIFTIKNRPVYHPLIVHIASFEQLSQWAKNIPATAAVLAEHFWPGPLTMLLQKHDQVSDIITGGLTTIAVRVPANTALLDILSRLNTGVAAPSANPHKRISPTTAAHVLSGLSGTIDAVLDGGPCSVGVESTIVDLTQERITILRPGPITQDMLQAVLKVPVQAPAGHAEHVPGNMKSHYQPYTKSSLMNAQQIKDCISLQENKALQFGIMHYSDLPTNLYAHVHTLKLSKNKAEYSARMYEALHQLDALQLDRILIETPPAEDCWHDIADRLSKACATEK